MVQMSRQESTWKYSLKMWDTSVKFWGQFETREARPCATVTGVVERDVVLYDCI